MKELKELNKEEIGKRLKLILEIIRIIIDICDLL